uniref:Secreted protein n=1 Tax=Zea mays TaxID=4577 RepID=C4J4P3_MAIZE|nr:unknown [Zea mays]
MALATAGVLRLALAAAMAVLRDAGLGAPQLGRLAGLVELPDDGVRIQQAGHRHLPLFRVDAALVDTVDLVEGLLDLLLAPVTVYVHSQHQSLHLEHILLAHPGTGTGTAPPLNATPAERHTTTEQEGFRSGARPLKSTRGGDEEGREGRTGGCNNIWLPRH